MNIDRILMRTLLLAILLIPLAPLNTVASPACSGADPAIMAVAVKGSNTDGKVTNYTIAGTVANLGRRGQASNVLQFVDISENGIRRDAKSIPPLRPGKSFVFTYVYQRSSDAGSGTSNLNFQIRFRNPSPPGSANCNSSNDTAQLTI